MLTAGRRERRKGISSIPNSLEAYLNLAQIATLQEVEGFGWELRYVRRPLFMEPVPILYNPVMDCYAVMDIEGCVNRSVEVALRH